MFKKRKKNYLSSIDKFLNDFDKENTELSKSKIKEIEKSDKIKELRD